MKKKILVTGAGGFIGHQPQLLAGGPHHDRAGFADTEGLDPGGDLEHGDHRAAAGP